MPRHSHRARARDFLEREIVAMISPLRYLIGWIVCVSSIHGHVRRTQPYSRRKYRIGIRIWWLAMFEE